MSLWIAGTDEGYEKGTTWLNHAASLWGLVDPKRGDEIRRWLQDWWAPHDSDPEIKSYAVATLELLQGLLEGLDDALRAEVTDGHWRLTAEAAARIPANKQWMVDSWDEPGGRVYTLANRVVEVQLVQRLIDKAIEMDRPLEVRQWAVT